MLNKGVSELKKKIELQHKNIGFYLNEESRGRRRRLHASIHVQSISP